VNEKEPKLGTYRQNLEVAAKKGTPRARANARKKLDGPAFPHALGYLHEWALDLHRARPGGPKSPARITWPDLHAWAAMTRRNPEPHEVEALLHLTRAMAFPSPEKAE
jgi:hypothetical protein